MSRLSSIIQMMRRKKTVVHEEKALVLMRETDDPPRPITVDGVANAVAILLLLLLSPKPFFVNTTQKNKEIDLIFVDEGRDFQDVFLTNSFVTPHCFL